MEKNKKNNKKPPRSTNQLAKVSDRGSSAVNPPPFHGARVPFGKADQSPRPPSSNSLKFLEGVFVAPGGDPIKIYYTYIRQNKRERSQTRSINTHFKVVIIASLRHTRVTVDRKRIQLILFTIIVIALVRHTRIQSM